MFSEAAWKKKLLISARCYEDLIWPKYVLSSPLILIFGAVFCWSIEFFFQDHKANSYCRCPLRYLCCAVIIEYNACRYLKDTQPMPVGSILQFDRETWSLHLIEWSWQVHSLISREWGHHDSNVICAHKQIRATVKRRLRSRDGVLNLKGKIWKTPSR